MKQNIFNSAKFKKWMIKFVLFNNKEAMWVRVLNFNYLFWYSAEKRLIRWMGLQFMLTLLWSLILQMTHMSGCESLLLSRDQVLNKDEPKHLFDRKKKKSKDITKTSIIQTLTHD